ncbi:MAG: ATP-binding protein [Saprospiraceae bacterium]|nr:tetratricopeptide repeat protein [Lewinella sp.]
MSYLIRRVLVWGYFSLLLIPLVHSGTNCDGPLFKQAEELYASKAYVAAAELYVQDLEGVKIKACSTYIYYRLGRINARLSLFPDAVDYYQKALNLAIEEDSFKIQGRILSSMAEVFSKTGEYEEAYTRETEALNIAIMLKDSAGISRSQYQLGTLAFNLRRFQEALDHYLVVDKMITSQKIGARHASVWSAIGLTYLELDSTGLAVKFLLASADCAKKCREEEILAYTIGNLAMAYMKRREFEVAENYFLESLQRKEQLSDKNGLIGGMIDYGTFLTLLHRFNEAENQLRGAVEMAEIIAAKNKLLAGYEALTHLFKESGKFEPALQYMEKVTALKDEILNEQTLNRIQNIKAQFEIRRREIEIQRLREVQEQKDINYSLKKKGVFIAFSIIFLVFLYGLHMNNELQKRNAKLEDSGNRLAAKNEELRSFAHVASHDLKEPLRTINSFTGLLRRKYLDKLDDRAVEYMDYINDGVQRMKNLLDDLLDYTRVDYSDERLEIVNSGELIRSAIGQLNAQIVNKRAQVIFTTEDFPEVEVMPSQIIQLFQNLVGNAIKFSNGHSPQVSIHCEKELYNAYRFSVKDNGIGIAAENREKIFEMFTRLHSRQEYEGTGIGLATCRKIVEKYGGKIWVESSPGDGATFFFTLPESMVSEEVG